ncbi:hypothetical protein TsFJ059_009722 [Trichoderma semiorbis]|uniref:Uncharacterized protein n=1 Tax=Trichoderma semiorbis TaxID=1491008 RepID=A0A9P8HPQ1_9HYPO|nr:hypothetical protein TsFJ059_009722 [Trichoderma semiorbis]
MRRRGALRTVQPEPHLVLGGLVSRIQSPNRGHHVITPRATSRKGGMGLFVLPRRLIKVSSFIRRIFSSPFSCDALNPTPSIRPHQRPCGIAPAPCEIPFRR